MKRMTGEWVAKAEGDMISADREFGAADNPNFDDACFHAQQCAEKYLKARLVEAGVDFPKTHDLDAILRLLLPIEPAWVALQDDIDTLAHLAVEVRYPGFSANAGEAIAAVEAARKVRAAARSSLGLPV